MGHISYGECFLCNNTYTRSGMSNHLRTCLRRHMGADHGTGAQFMHLAIRGIPNADYWLHILIPAHAALATLDDLLRAVWLDCCGHYSMFSIAGDDYVSHEPSSALDVQSMNTPMHAVLGRGDTFTHTYDMGSPTRLHCRVVDTVTLNSSAPRDALILARNLPPQLRCDCGDIAMACTPAAESGAVRFMCDHCMADYVEAGYPVLPVTNSPRVGTCAYTGTTDPYPEHGDTLSGHALVRDIAAAELSTVSEGEGTALATWPTLHPAALQRAFAAAAMFYAESPWDVLWTDEVLMITIGNRTLYAVILGEHNDVFGIALYATEADVKAALAPVLNGRISTPQGSLVVFFAPAAMMPPAASELAVKIGLPLASPEAYPLTVRTKDGQLLPLRFDEVDVIVAVLQAVALFVRKYRDRLARGMDTRDTVPVRTPHIIGAAVQYSPPLF